MRIAKRIIGWMMLFATLSIVGCQCERNATSSDVKFGAFNDETYVWENYQFTTNRVIEVK